jgi:hypothetical protein
MDRLPEAQSAWQGAALRAIGRGLASRGEIKDALGTIEVIEIPRDRAWGYFEIAHVPFITSKMGLKCDLLRRSFSSIEPVRMSESLSRGYDREDEYTLLRDLMQAQARIETLKDAGRPSARCLPKRG